jgi:hypothetical protein
MATLPPDNIEGVESGAGTLSVGSDGLMSREIELRFLVRSMEGYSDAEDKGRELAPLYYDGHRRGTLQCRPVGGGWYQISVNYSNAGVNAYEGWGVENSDGVVLIPNGISVDTTGGSEHITQAIKADGYEAAGPSAPNSYKAINVSGNQVNGVTKTVPAFNFTETWLVPAWYLMVGSKKEGVGNDGENDPGALTPYAQTLREMTGTINKDKWRIFEGGEVLFLGARYDVSRASSLVPVTYSFSVQLSKNDFKVGDIEVYSKQGWDYMWIVYEDAIDANFPVKKPKYVYIDQIYEETDFRDLGIGMKWGQHFMFTGDTFAHPLVEAKRDKV